MESWLALAIVAQFLFAVTTLIDKHIVVRAAHIGKPVVYAFYVALLSGFVLAIAPFRLVGWPSDAVFFLSIVNAATFVTGIYFLYSALQHARASDVAPVVGATSAVVTVILAAIWIRGDVSSHAFVPILLLVAGTAFISHYHFSKKALRNALASGIFLGLTVFLAKLIFLQSSFIDGFFWTRSMNVVVALSLLLVPSFRKAIFHGGKKSSHSAKMLVLSNKVIAGIASVLTALAVSIGSVSVVNALAGLQFVFLFLFALLFARSMPLTSGEKTGSHGGWRSAAGVTLIVLGLAGLYVA